MRYEPTIPANLRHTLLPLLAGTLAFLLHLPYLWIEFDPHHDGLMLAQVVAQLEGKSVHSEYFSMYGPLTPVSQALFHLLLGLEPTIITLRLWGVIHVAGATALVASLGLVAPPTWQLRKGYTVGAGLGWASMSSVISQNHLMPWPTLLSGFMIALVAVLFSLSMSRLSSFGIKEAGPFLVSTGLVLGLLPFVRINHGGFVFAGLVASVLLCMVFRARIIALAISLVGAAGLFAVVAVLGVLAATGTLSGFFLQSVFIPLKWSSEALDGWNTWDSLANLFVQNLFGPSGVFLLLIALLLAASVIADRYLRDSREFNRWLTVASAVGVLGYWLYVTESFVPLVNVAYRPSSSNLEKGVSAVLSSEGRILYAAFFISLMVIVALAIHSFCALAKNEQAQKRDFLGFILFLGISSSGFTQVVPTWDIHHVWWGMTLGLVPISIIFRRLRSISDSLVTVASTVVGLIVLSAGYSSSIAAGDVLSRWENRGFEEPLSKLVPVSVILSDERTEQLETINRLLAQLPPDDASVDFWVADGYLAVAGGTYRDDDEWFLGWTILQSERPNPTGEYVVVDVSLFSEPEDAFRSASSPAFEGYREVGCFGSFCVLTR